jgi:hypothetical protein
MAVDVIQTDYKDLDVICKGKDQAYNIPYSNQTIQFSSGISSCIAESYVQVLICRQMCMTDTVKVSIFRHMYMTDTAQVSICRQVYMTDTVQVSICRQMYMTDTVQVSICRQEYMSDAVRDFPHSLWANCGMTLLKMLRMCPSTSLELHKI